MAESTSGSSRVGYVQLAVVVVVLGVGIYFGQAPDRIVVDPATPLGMSADPRPGTMRPASF